MFLFDPITARLACIRNKLNNFTVVVEAVCFEFEYNCSAMLTHATKLVTLSLEKRQ